ncbi:putative quinol monooxygenase [Radiobacillus sp. PE A8.2]|uniref:putative quinol monooxygenase n=1 Tax=Radiobacillus sp. PE A8.2 TaxID=3380349 RepID=UPI00388F29AF
MNKFCTYGKFVAHEGKRDQLVEILLQAAESLESLDECHMYAVNISEDEPNAVWVVEFWQDEAAHTASLSLKSTKSLIQQGRPLIAAMEGNRLSVIGGKGI